MQVVAGLRRDPTVFLDQLAAMVQTRGNIGFGVTKLDVRLDPVEQGRSVDLIAFGRIAIADLANMVVSQIQRGSVASSCPRSSTRWIR